MHLRVLVLAAAVMSVAALVAPTPATSQTTGGPPGPELGVYLSAFSHSGYVDPGIGLRAYQPVLPYLAIEADLMYVDARDGGVACADVVQCPEYYHRRFLFPGFGFQLRAPTNGLAPYGGAAYGVRSEWSRFTYDRESRLSPTIFLGARLPRGRAGLFGELRTRGARYETAATTYYTWSIELGAGGYLRFR